MWVCFSVFDFFNFSWNSFSIDDKVPTEVIARSSSVLKHTICHMVCLFPLDLRGIPNFELDILLFVSSQDYNKMSALFLVYQNTQVLKR